MVAPTCSIALALILLLAVAVSAQPEGDFENDQADSLQAADLAEEEGTLEAEEEGAEEDAMSPDSLGAGGSPRPGRRGGDESAFEPVEFSFWRDTNPDLSVKVSRNKDVTNWETKLALRERISSRLNFNLSASLNTRENTTLNRSDSNDGVTASMKYNLSEMLALGVRYNSKVTAFRYSLDAKDPAERKGKEEVSVSAELDRGLVEGVDLHLSMNAGATKNAYADVSNSGRRKDLAASVSYAPNASLRSSVSYTAKSTLLDSDVDSSGVTLFSSVDESFAQDLAFTISYDVRPGVKISADASRNERKKEHPDPARLKQETEMRTSRRAGASARFDMWSRLSWDVSMRFSENENLFDLRSESDNSARSTTLDGSAKIDAWRGAVFNVGGSWDNSRNIYKATDTGNNTGDNIYRALSLKYTQDLGRKADMNVTALSDITSVVYDNKDESVGNPKDRDRINNRLTMTVSYQPVDAVKTRFGAEYSDERTVYTQASQSWSNRNTRRFRVTGSYDLETFRDVGLKQDYDISALYTFYEFGENRNTLIRNSNIRTKITFPIAPKLNFNVDHQFKFQDQGGYREVGGQSLYARSSERETNILGINLRYVPIRALKLSVRSSYQLQRNYKYIEGERSFDYEIPTTTLSGKIAFNHKWSDRTSISISVEQNRKEGSRVSDAFRNYRNIEFEASHVF
jgi:hypothetical protein